MAIDQRRKKLHNAVEAAQKPWDTSCSNDVAPLHSKRLLEMRLVYSKPGLRALAFKSADTRGPSRVEAWCRIL